MRPFGRLRRPSQTVVLTVLLAGGCKPGTDTANPSGDSATRRVTIYCSVDAAFAEPILQEFERRSGVAVHYTFDTEAGKTTGLVNKLLAEKDNPRADVWWSSEIFGTMQLAAAGVLAPYRPSTALDIPNEYRDAGGLWTAFGLRGRVLAYDPKRTKRDDLPKRWVDLTDPVWKGRVCMADPRFGTTRGHMATLLSLWGPEAMSAYFGELKANGTRLTDGNSMSVLLVARGAADLAATDTDDVIVAQERGDSIDMVYPDLDAPDGGTAAPGTLWIPCSVALVRGAAHAEETRALIDYLVSAEIEEKLHASASRNVPVRPALREKLKIDSPAAAVVDYSAAAAALRQSDQLVRDVLLK